MNPHATPPRNPSNSQHTHSQSKASNANTSPGRNSSKSQSNNTSSQTNRGPQSKQQQSHSQQGQQKTGSSNTKTETPPKPSPNTGWFTAPELKLTPFQELVQKIENHCSGSEPTFLAMILGFAALIGPLFVISGTLGAIFPELPGHYPDWLMMTMLGASGWCTCSIFRWFFAEAELINPFACSTRMIHQIQRHHSVPFYTSIIAPKYKTVFGKLPI